MKFLLAAIVALCMLALGLESGYSIGRNAEAQDHKAYIAEITGVQQ